jgi:hypothetical protein
VCTRVTPNATCADGHTGPVCSVCFEGYVKDAMGVCQTCASAGVSFSFYIFCFIFGATTIYFVLIKIFGKDRLSIASVTQEFTKATFDDSHWSKRYKTKAKILTSFYQIISQLPMTLAIKFSDLYMGFNSFLSSIFSLNIFGFINVGCILPTSVYGFYGKLKSLTLIN